MDQVVLLVTFPISFKHSIRTIDRQQLKLVHISTWTWLSTRVLIAQLHLPVIECKRLLFCWRTAVFIPGPFTFGSSIFFFYSLAIKPVRWRILISLFPLRLCRKKEYNHSAWSGRISLWWCIVGLQKHLETIQPCRACTVVIFPKCTTSWIYVCGMLFIRLFFFRHITKKYFVCLLQLLLNVYFLWTRKTKAWVPN